MATAEQLEPADEIVRIAAIWLRRAVGSQAEAIRELSQAGFPNPRIAELLGTTPATVRTTLSEARKPSRTKKAGT